MAGLARTLGAAPRDGAGGAAGLEPDKRPEIRVITGLGRAHRPGPTRNGRKSWHSGAYSVAALKLQKVRPDNPTKVELQVDKPSMATTQALQKQPAPP
jgi:hypothetical protein